MKAVHFLASLAILLGSGGANAQQIVTKQVEIGDFGACLLRQAPSMSEKLLRTKLASPEERNTAETLAKGHNACIRGRVLTGRSGAIRGAVAQAAFWHTPALLDALGARTATAIVRPPVADGRAFLIEYATCLVAADPQRTAAFLRTQYGVADERKAFVAYGDTLTGCMPIGEQYNVDIPDLRNQIVAIAWQAVDPSEAK